MINFKYAKNAECFVKITYTQLMLSGLYGKEEEIYA
jgi:hypothetical protein